MNTNSAKPKRQKKVRGCKIKNPYNGIEKSISAKIKKLGMPESPEIIEQVLQKLFDQTQHILGEGKTVMQVCKAVRLQEIAEAEKAAVLRAQKERENLLRLCGDDESSGGGPGSDAKEAKVD